MEYKVISADNHIIEAPHTFTEYLPAEYKDRAPRILRGADGGDGWSFDGKPPRMTFGLNAVAGRPFEQYKASGLTLEEILPGNYDGAAHLKDMDADGIDAATIYPMASLWSYVLEDRPFALAVMRAYNDWLLDEFCAVDRRRLIGLPILPVDDGMDILLAELERVATKGAKGVFIPYFSERPYWDRYYDPFWIAAVQAPVAVCIHRTMGGKEPPAAVTPMPDAAPGVNLRRDRAAVLHRRGAVRPAHLYRAVRASPGPEVRRCRGERGLVALLGADDGPGVRAPAALGPSAAAHPASRVRRQEPLRLGPRRLRRVRGRQARPASWHRRPCSRPITRIARRSSRRASSTSPISLGGLDDDRKQAILAGNAVRVFNLA